MRILCWNLGVAYGRFRDDPVLHERAWHWIAALDPDLAFLQEVRAPAWAQERWQVLVGPYQFFASALLARRDADLRPASLPDGGILDRFGSYLATAELDVSGIGSLLVASVHTSAAVAPPWGHPGLDRAAIARPSVGEPWWNDVAYAAYSDLVRDRCFIVAGDWNTARWPDEHGVPEPAGAEFFERAAAAGWVDVSLDAEGREGRSWYGTLAPRPYQPDHVFSDRMTAALVRTFEIEPWPVLALGLSDHAPLLLTLEVGGDRAALDVGSDPSD
jgi:exonuclease III